ncbi:MAG: cohesin domain-containing protein, partial [Bacteroidota bacterium]
MKKDSISRRSFHSGKLSLPIILILLFASPLLASNYYWVGGTGTWSDYATHWATTSGGTVFHVTIPSPSDDVFFDVNSFPATGDTVYLDTTITNCKTMDWTGATNAPTIYCPEFSNIILNIYGSFLLTPGMHWNAGGALNLRASGSANVINTAGVTLTGAASWDGINLSFMNNATYNLQSPLIVQPSSQGDIHLLKGTLFTNGYPITCEDFTMDSAALFLDTSFVTCSQWSTGYHVLLLDADSAFMNCNNLYAGKNQVYANVSGYGISGDSCVFHDVQCEHLSTNASSYHNVNMVSSYNSINGTDNTFTSCILSAATCNIFANLNTFDTLIFSSPGQQVQIANGSTIIVNGSLSANGSCAGLTAITSAGTGTINKASGSVNLNYVLLQNITGTGGAVFTANNSIDAGNVTGFIINAPAPQNLYWVGGTGNWSDVNHWSVSSGGAGGSCVPTQYDDVFFDANSFPSANDSIYIDFPIVYCKNMDWTGAANAPTIYCPEFSNIILNIYGSFLLTPGMHWNAGGALNLRASGSANVINTAGVTLTGAASWDGINLSFMNNATYNLQSPLIVQPSSQGDIHLLKGTLFTNGYPITCEDFTMDSAALFLDTSFVTCSQWSTGYHVLLLDADSAFMNCNNLYAGKNQVYANVSGYGISGDSCVFHDVQCEHLSTNASSYHNVNMVSSYNSINGTDNTFTSCILSAATCNISASVNTFDTLIFSNPGQQIEISNNSTLQVNDFLFIQSNPGFPTSIECNSGTATISKPTDTVCTDFIYLKNITATGGAIFFAGDHSVDLGGNTGWNWVRCAPLISNVWPGDCNYDLVTDNFDLLNIGVSFGDTGYVRPAASMSYTAQPCQDWYYQFINGVNVKHADCDGNGTVDANDTLAIGLNYGLTHPARLMHQDENNSTGTYLAFVLPPVIVPGSSVSVPVTLGTSADPASGVYGIAFTVNYDPAFIQPGTMSVDYASSWVENAGNHLHIEKDFPGAGKTDIAFTRINHSDASGYGIIATLNFVVSPTANGPFNLSFSHVKVI